MYSREEIKIKITEYINKKFEITFGDDDINDDTDLFAEGHIDSLESMILLTFFEVNFGITVNSQDLIDNTINSLHEMVDFIVLKQG